MWNKIDPLIQPIARKVEKSNPRMDIRRDESENYDGRKRREEEENSFSISWEDSTVVSVVGLRNFLQSLIGGEPPPVTETGEGERPPSPLLSPASPVSANTYMSRAASAYQATGKIVHDRNIEMPPVIPPPAESVVSLGSDFGEEDVADIKKYIEALSDLEARGITEIALLRTLTFLESVKQGIEAARI